MGTEQQYCYTNPQGEIIYLFTLRNGRGTVAKISNYGATITSLKVNNKDSGENDLVLGFEKMEDYLSPSYLAQYPWFGCAVGRYANRIGQATFTLDGKEYQLARNNGAHQLHGGPAGFDRRVWKVQAHGSDPLPFLELKYLSADGEQGYPGNLHVTLRFELNEQDELKHEFSATADHPTPCNLTHHSYFNLNNGQGDILDHEVKIYASRMLEQDEELVATGNLLAVEGTAYDLRDFKKVSEGLGKIPEYDKSFVVDRHDRELKLVAETRYLPKNLTLQVFSTEPVVHFYSGKWTPVVIGKSGIPYGPWSGLCLETHVHPNAVNIPGFPDTILRPGKAYHQLTVYKII